MGTRRTWSGIGEILQLVPIQGCQLLGLRLGGPAAQTETKSVGDPVGVSLSGRGWSTEGTPGWTSLPGYRKLPLVKTWLVRGFSSSFMTRLLGEVNCLQKARSSDSLCRCGVSRGGDPAIVVVQDLELPLGPLDGGNCQDAFRPGRELDVAGRLLVPGDGKTETPDGLARMLSLMPQSDGEPSPTRKAQRNSRNENGLALDPIQNRHHTVLLIVDSTLGIDGGVAVETGGDLLLGSGVGQQVSREASGDGARPSCSNRSRTKRSMVLRTQAVSFTFGRGGRTGLT